MDRYVSESQMTPGRVVREVIILTVAFGIFFLMVWFGLWLVS